ncbi:MAG: hypothetical protein QOH14_3730, partial [Pseudonocardiales bacterium]|nr:hypothetical protein [Pseudonocardiales bacterium]
MMTRAAKAGIDEAVDIWNHAVAQRPAIVASCTSSSDVVAALA